MPSPEPRHPALRQQLVGKCDPLDDDGYSTPVLTHEEPHARRGLKAVTRELRDRCMAVGQRSPSAVGPDRGRGRDTTNGTVIEETVPFVRTGMPRST